MRRTLIRRTAAILIVVLVFAQMAQAAYGYHEELLAEAAAAEEGPAELTLWYTDEKLNAWLVEAASEFEAENDVEITLQLVTAVDYIEHINTASTTDLGGPDLFVVSSELLEKARLAGLTVENDSFSEEELDALFPQQALNAATCGEKLVAYPFYFETCFLLYNKNYVEEVPDTIDDILEYAENFEGDDSTASVENIFKWNVGDIFSNFFFIANYVNLGGETGDDSSQVELDAEEVVECLEYYQSLNAYFAIDEEEVTTDSVLEEFIDGKTVFTIAKTDAIATIDAAVAEAEAAEALAAAESEEEEEDESEDSGDDTDDAEDVEESGNSEGEADEEETEEEEYFYGIAEVPDLTDDLQTKGLSVTNSIAVNAYSGEKDLAKAFARFLTVDKADSLYSMAGKMPVCLDVEYENEEMETLIDQYENSVEVTKLTDLSNYWIEMEITFANIWAGNDVGEEVDAVTEQIMSQLD